MAFVFAKNRIHVVVLLFIAILMAGYALRLCYALRTSPYIDEYFTILAAQAIADHGTPVLPSSMFYNHGLLFSYLAALFGTAVAGGRTPLSFAPELPYRLTSVFLGTVTIAITYRIGKQQFSPLAGLLAAGLMAFEFESIVWGGRARMYSLLAMMSLLTVYALFRGSYGRGNPRWGLYGLLLLVLSFATHSWTIILLGALLPAIVLSAWFSRPANAKPWYWRWSALGALLGLGLVFYLGLRVVLFLGVGFELLGQAPQVSAQGADSTTAQKVMLLLRQVRTEFSPKELRYLSEYALESDLFRRIAFVMAGIGMLFSILAAGLPTLRKKIERRQLTFGVFLTIIVAIALIEITFVSPRSPELRYYAPLTPLICLLAGGCLHFLQLNLRSLEWKIFPPYQHVRLAVIGLVSLIFIGTLGWSVTQRLTDIDRDSTPAYDRAFRFVRDNLQEGDVLATINTPASGLYLGRADYFIGQYQIGPYLATNSAGREIDRWWGAPHVSTGADLQQALESHTRVWLVVDGALFNEHYFGADWFLVTRVNMQRVWEEGRIIVLVSKPQLVSLNLKPAVALDEELADLIRPRGYNLSLQPTLLTLTLFWQAQKLVDFDYTQFVHVRDAANRTVLQADKQPVSPTTRWRPGELVADIIQIPVPADIPPGVYKLLVGMYRWDTLDRVAVVGDQTGENAVLLEQLHVTGDRR
jgi:4-amino-4-deoxy-L-arabinose transferase-like glycosyltransferase